MGKRNIEWPVAVTFLGVALLVTTAVVMPSERHQVMAAFAGLDRDGQHEVFTAMRDHLHHEMIPDGDYRCCLAKACTSCAALDPWHGEGASCSCLEDVVNGRPPCGECVGGIMMGRGNPLLAKYFASSIAGKLGAGHAEALKRIIEEQYGTPVADQY